MTACACECAREDGHGIDGSAGDVIDSSRLQPIFTVVARDRAADRGCTGGCDGAEDVGPPGEIRGGFSFWVSQRMELRWCVRRQTRGGRSLPSSSLAFGEIAGRRLGGRVSPPGRDSRLMGATVTTVRRDPALKSGAILPVYWLLPSRATSPVSSRVPWLVSSLVFWPGPRRVSPGTCRICSRAA